MPDEIAEMLNELIARIEKLEENQRAIDGAFLAAMAVLSAHRPPAE
jgi:uncharacterized protein (UPF0335 family)